MVQQEFWLFLHLHELHIKPSTIRMSENLPPQSPLSPKQQEKLSELTSQSWNLELVISGAALFAVLQLPEVLDNGFEYIRYNLIAKTTGVSGLFPQLALSTMKASCYVLFVAFLANFIMRAFWVGLVGLLAVYPEGIHYDRIPFTSKRNQQRMEDELGTLEGYILALDRRCNIVFAIAFLFVLFLIMMASSYLLILVLHTILRPLIPVYYLEILKVVFYAVLIFYVVAGSVASLPQLKNKPALDALQNHLASLNRMILWGLYRPVNFILNTFYSHVPPRKLIQSVMLMTGVFIVLLFGQLLYDMSHMEGSRISLNRRHLYAGAADSGFIDLTAYDDQRGPDQLVGKASIQSDVIREPFVRIFIAYPKTLDTLLTSITPQPKWPGRITKKEKQELFAKWSLEQVNKVVQLRVNDSLYVGPDLMLTRRGPQRQVGWQTVLFPSNLKRGKNNIRIAMGGTNLDKENTLISIPFWYMPEKP